jgi:hypothetical protein
VIDFVDLELLSVVFRNLSANLKQERREEYFGIKSFQIGARRNPKVSPEL